MKTLLAIPLLCSAIAAQAACPVKRPGEQPLLPEGETASAEEIRKARREADLYRLQVETYLGCGVMNRRQHYRLQAQLEVFMENYARELTAFQAQETLVAEN
jgi:hypothetical protein